MDRFCFLMLGVLLASPPVAAAGDATQEIMRVDQHFQDAVQQRDRATLESLVADPFVWVHASDGRIEDRRAWIDAAARGMALSGQRSVRTEHGATFALYGEPPHTAVRVARVRLRFGERENWIRQTKTYVRADGRWKLASGQGVIMYEGPALDAQLHSRYAGTYAIDGQRALVLAWEDGALLATFPGGATTQVFLASPTQEAVRVAAVGALHFTLDAAGVPVVAALVRGGKEVWRGVRQP